MQRLKTVGLAVAALSVAGYAAGVAIPYPGRAFSITGFIAGITLYAIGGSS